MPVTVADVVDLVAWRGDGQPLITGADGLTLRPWEPDDVDVVVRAYADPAVVRWHMQTQTPAEAADWVARRADRFRAGSGADWMVTSGGPDPRALGRIGFNRLDLAQGEAEIAYWTLPEARGARVAPRAVRALTGWAFDRGLVRLGIRHSTQNPASCRVATAAGFTLEGTLRGAALHADGRHDMHLHARLATDPG